MDIITKLIDMFKKEAEVSAHDLLGMEGLSARNEARMAKIKDDMGSKYILHPSHKKTRLKYPRPV